MTSELPNTQGALTAKAGGHCKRFRQDESGLITIFATFMLIMILMVCGIAVDLMRNEIERTRLQNTLDRAIVAAADLDSTLDAEEVVMDYFAKSGVSDYLESVVVTPGDFLPTSHFRTVEAIARARTPSPYMRMTGVDSLPVFTTGKAEEVISNVEVSLIVDVSGSMNSNSRLKNLKIAAKDFIDQVLENSQEDRLHISIIPYATQVSLPDSFADYMNLTNEHDYANCVNFSGSDFNDTAVTSTEELERTMYFDPWNDYDGRDDDPNVNFVQRPVCESMSSREALLFQNDATTLKNFIEAMTARGYTSIDLGMKWGVAMLDPQLNSVVRKMVDDAVVPGVFADRPKPYGDEDTMKVIVLMTDGQNTSQYYVEDDHRRGFSEVWWNARDEVYSMYDDRGTSKTSDDRYFYRDADGNLRDANGNNTGHQTRYSTAIGYGNLPYGCDPLTSNPEADEVDEFDCTATSRGGGTQHLSYADLWAFTSVKANQERNYNPWWNDNTAKSVWRTGVYDTVGTSTKNNRTDAICDAAKDEQVVVFTIGFEAPSGGTSVLKSCASSHAHFFDVDGLEIADAFTAIAHEITQLRLTQ